MSLIVVNGKSYELTDEPKHGVVRKVRKERNEAIKGFLSLFTGGMDLEIPKQVKGEDPEKEEQAKLQLNASVDKELNRLMKDHPQEAIEFGNSQMELNIRSTISLACNHFFAEDDLDELTEKQIEEAYAKCMEVLGGDVEAFFGH